jgi:hypothetical protein
LGLRALRRTPPTAVTPYAEGPPVIRFLYGFAAPIQQELRPGWDTSLGETIQGFLVSLGDPAQVIHERLVGSDFFDLGDERVYYYRVDADAPATGDYFDLVGELLGESNGRRRSRHAVVISRHQMVPERTRRSSGRLSAAAGKAEQNRR